MKILITGGTHGMGKGVAKVLAGIDNQVHEIIILCRSKELGEAVSTEIVNTTSNKKISIIMAPLYIEHQDKNLKRSGKFITWKKNEFVDVKEDSAVLDQELQDRLWKISLELCADEKTNQIAANLQS
jgi:short-subunit dehydrogenase involved in D-alanine esterification of teichoic acids